MANNFKVLWLATRVLFICYLFSGCLRKNPNLTDDVTSSSQKPSITPIIFLVDGDLEEFSSQKLSLTNDQPDPEQEILKESGEVKNDQATQVAIIVSTLASLGLLGGAGGMLAAKRLGITPPLRPESVLLPPRPALRPATPRAAASRPSPPPETIKPIPLRPSPHRSPNSLPPLFVATEATPSDIRGAMEFGASATVIGTKNKVQQKAEELQAAGLQTKPAPELIPPHQSENLSAINVLDTMKGEIPGAEILMWKGNNELVLETTPIAELKLGDAMTNVLMRDRVKLATKVKDDGNCGFIALYIAKRMNERQPIESPQAINDWIASQKILIADEIKAQLNGPDSYSARLSVSNKIAEVVELWGNVEGRSKVLAESLRHELNYQGPLRQMDLFDRLMESPTDVLARLYKEWSLEISGSRLDDMGIKAMAKILDRPIGFRTAGFYEIHSGQNSNQTPIYLISAQNHFWLGHIPPKP